MQFSRTELQLMENLGRGLSKPKELAKAMSKSPQQTYASLKSLNQKGMISQNRNLVGLSKKIHVILLTKLLIRNPSLKDVLSDSGIKLLLATINPRSAADLINKTGLKKSIVYKKLKQGINLSILRKEKEKYALNEKIWGGLKEALTELKNYEENLDPRVPVDATIYHKDDSEIVFSTIRSQEASLTAFSAYKDHGLSVFSPANYYYLPKKKLSLKDIFLHSLLAVEKDKEHRALIYTALFYLKHRNSLKGINNPVLENIKKVISGEKINDYPSLREIKEKAQQYHIKVKRGMPR